jgi:N-acetylglucosamine-6-phosphate deacetylase
MNNITGNIVYDNKIVYAKISFDKKINNIEIISEEKNDKDYIVPGFVETHSHGAAGFDVNSSDENQMKEIYKAHFKNGVTTFYPATVTAEQNDLIRTAKVIKKVSESKENLPDVLGIHLEGPFINSHKKGAQPKFFRDYNIDELKEINQIFPVKIVTASPEISDYRKFAEYTNKKGIKLQIGHSNACYRNAVKALKNGFNGITHLYNTMSGLHHRDAGIVGAAFYMCDYAEIITDLVHVTEDAYKIAVNNIKNLYAVSDSCSATTMPNGKYNLGGTEVIKKDDAVYMPNGILAGSCTTMYQCFLNILKMNLGFIKAVKMTSTNQANYLGLEDRGEILKNKISDFVVLNSDYKIKDIYKSGRLYKEDKTYKISA